MKRAKTALAMAIVVAVLMLGGCLDVLQYVSGTSYDVTVFTRFTIERSVFQVAAAMGADPSEMEMEMTEELPLDEAAVTGELPEWLSAEFNTIDTPMEYGFELRYTAPREQLARLRDDEAELVPRVGRSSMVIPLSGGSDTSSDPVAGAMLGTAKYRLMISKLFLSRVSAAHLVDGEEVHELTVTDLPDVWLIEFPISLWFGAGEAPRIEVIY